MSNNTNTGGGRTDLKAWGLGILATVIVLLLGWIGVSNLQSLAFQSAVAPQIDTLVTETKATKQTVNDIKVEMSGYATKEQLTNEVNKLRKELQEMELELVRVCVQANLSDCNKRYTR